MLTAVVLLNCGVALETAVAQFEQMGFQTEKMVGGSLTITGTEDMFETGFGTPMAAFEKGGETLPLNDLPADLRSLVDAVEFQQPPEFGPSNF